MPAVEPAGLTPLAVLCTCGALGKPDGDRCHSQRLYLKGGDYILTH